MNRLTYLDLAGTNSLLEKATYQYREALIKAVINPVDQSQAIARTTATTTYLLEPSRK